MAGFSATVSPVRRFKNGIFGILCFSGVVIAGLLLVMLLVSIVRDGIGRLNPDFFQNFTSRIPRNAGIRASAIGSLWVVALTALISVPIGVAAAVYLEEFTTRKNRVTEFIQINIANLAGVPSIVYGLLGLELFVRWMAFDRSVISGALTLSLLILPMIILVSQESLRAVPRSYREASYALGASPWTVIRTQVIPNAASGIFTGIILALSRAIGESAPLITIGAVTFINFVPTGVRDKFTVLPIQIFDWASRPQTGFHEAAAGAIIVLMGLLLFMNSFAIFLRYRARAKASR